MSLGPLFGLAPSPISVVPGGTAATSGLAWARRVLAFPALGWPARRDVLCWGHGLRHFPGFLSLGARLDAVDPAREPVPFGAPVTSGLSFDSRLVAVSAEAAGLGLGLGLGEFLLVIGPSSFFSGLGRQRDSLFLAFLRCCPFSASFLFGIVCSRARLFLLASSLGAMVSIDKKLSFRMVYPATICPTLPRTLPWRPWRTWAVPGGALKRRRATWGWTSTRPGAGRAGITISQCACWAGHSCWTCSRNGGEKMPRITRPQVYRVVREMLPREQFEPDELLLWLADTQLRNERARRSHAKRPAALRTSPDTPGHPSLNRRCNTKLKPR